MREAKSRPLKIHHRQQLGSQRVNSSPLDKMATSSQTTFSNAFSRMKNFVFCRISLKFVLEVQLIMISWFDNDSALVQVMAWHRTGNKPLPEPMLLSSLTHVCGSRGGWVNTGRLTAQDKIAPSWRMAWLKWLKQNDMIIKYIHTWTNLNLQHIKLCGTGNTHVWNQSFCLDHSPRVG